MRSSSALVFTYLTHQSRTPTPLEAISAILDPKITSTPDLVTLVGNNERHKDAYNLRNLGYLAAGMADNKPTIEFRQHEGCMNGERTVNWVKTVVGIVDYVRDCRGKHFTALLAMADCEVWEKEGDGLDLIRESLYGPTLSESSFTVVDLLEVMGLYGPALFYQRRGIYRWMPPFEERFEGQRDLRAENGGADLRVGEEFLRQIRGFERDGMRPLMAVDNDSKSESESQSESESESGFGLGERRVETSSDPESSSLGEVL